MPLYIEGLWWYLLLLDCLLYNAMTWSKPYVHRWETHWLSPWFPLNSFFALFYTVLVLWTGFALYRMQLLGFYF